MYCMVIQVCVKRIFQLLIEKTTAFAGKSSINHHNASQMQSTGNYRDFIFERKRKQKDELLLSRKLLTYSNTYLH